MTPYLSSAGLHVLRVHSNRIQIQVIHMIVWLWQMIWFFSRDIQPVDLSIWTEFNFAQLLYMYLRAGEMPGACVHACVCVCVCGEGGR